MHPGLYFGCWFWRIFWTTQHSFLLYHYLIFAILHEICQSNCSSLLWPRQKSMTTFFFPGIWHNQNGNCLKMQELIYPEDCPFVPAPWTTNVALTLNAHWVGLFSFLYSAVNYSVSFQLILFSAEIRIVFVDQNQWLQIDTYWKCP